MKLIEITSELDDLRDENFMLRCALIAKESKISYLQRLNAELLEQRSGLQYAFDVPPHFRGD